MEKKTIPSLRIHLNMGKCKVTTYIHELQKIHRKRERDDALRARLAHITLDGRPIGSLTQDETLPGGYLGTSLRASLSPEAQLHWTKAQLTLIGDALRTIPLPPHIKQRLLLYGVHSKITHTHTHTLLDSPFPISYQRGRCGARNHIKENLESPRLIS